MGGPHFLLFSIVAIGNNGLFKSPVWCGWWWWWELIIVDNIGNI